MAHALNPSILKADLKANAGERQMQHPEFDPYSASAADGTATGAGKKYHHTDSKAILLNPSTEASGYHQSSDVLGFRFKLVLFRGWTLRLLVRYFDSARPLGAGPSAEKWHAIMRLIKSMN